MPDVTNELNSLRAQLAKGESDLEAGRYTELEQDEIGAFFQTVKNRVLEEHETSLEALRQALKEGEESGYAEYSLKGLIADLDNESAH